MRLGWGTGAVLAVVAIIVFASGMKVGAFVEVEREGSAIELRTAIERCETTIVGGFEIVPDKQCRKVHPVNYIYQLPGSSSAGDVAANNDSNGGQTHVQNER